MSDDPLSDWPDRTPLRDESGDVVLMFSATEGTRDATPWADGVWVPPGVSTGRAAELALSAMPAWRLSTSDGRLVTTLVAAGARERRHAHSMTLLMPDATSAATATPTPAPSVSGVQVEALTPAQVDRHALRLAAMTIVAYPEGHPDAFDGDEGAAVSQVRAIARGEMLGPMMPESRIALVDNEIVGACLVVDRSGKPPHGGPWVIDLFRDPGHPARGVGTALLTAVVDAVHEAGLPGLSLVVSHNNVVARRLYDRLGFRDIDENWTLTLPAESERPAS